MIAQFGRTMTFCLLDCRRLIRFWPNLLLWKKRKKKQIDDLQTVGGIAGGIDKKTVDTEVLGQTLAVSKPTIQQFYKPDVMINDQCNRDEYF